MLKESGLPDLIELIQNTYRHKAARIQAENKTVGLQSCLRQAIDLLSGVWEKSSTAIGEYENYKNEYEMEIEHVRGDFEEQLDEILQKHKNRWYGNIENRAKTLMKEISGIDSSLSEHEKSERLRSKVESSVIHTKELKRDIEEAFSLYEKSINSIVRRWSNRIKFDEYVGIDELIQKERALIKICDSSGFQSASFNFHDADASGSVLGGGAIGIGAALILAPLIGPLAFLVPFIGGWLGWLFKGDEFKSKLRQATDSAIDQARKDVQQHAQDISISSGWLLMEHLNREFMRLYFDFTKGYTVLSDIESEIRSLRFEPEKGRVTDLLLRSKELR